MPETTTRDAKLIQYLGEAHRKEKELEQSLQVHIGMTELDSQKAYKRRLQDHLKETKRHARELERRIKKLGGEPGRVESALELASKAAGRGMATVKGQTHLVRGTGAEEKLLKNAKTEYFNEHEEIATYTAIETLAEAVGDRDTAKLARQIRREEERMARFLEGLIPRLTKAVARAEIPASERRTATRRRRPRRSSGAAGSSSRTGGRSRSSSGKRSGSRRSPSSRSASSRSRQSNSRSSSRSRQSSSRSSSRSGSRRS